MAIKKLADKKLASIYKENLKIFEEGGYKIGDKFINVKRDSERDVNIYINHTGIDNIRKTVKHEDKDQVLNICFSHFDCVKHILKLKYSDSTLLVNFANPIHPGGGVLNGYEAQEEDICRKSNLMQFLTDSVASRYYRDNKTYQQYTKACIGLDNVIVSRGVTIFRDGNNNLLEEPVVVDVLTIAAPKLSIYAKFQNLCGEENYVKALKSRIDTIFIMGWYYGYSNLILGAFGCGVFNNPPEIVSEIMFHDVIEYRNDFSNIDFPIKTEKPDTNGNFQSFLTVAKMHRLISGVDRWININ